MMQRLHRGDLMALCVLLAMWLAAFGHALPIRHNSSVPANGDFYGQFYTFSVYQYERMAAGEIPLWNPYNNGGFPFIADPQSAVFYPPRLLTIGLANLIGGWSVQALLLEGLTHFLIASLGWYAFLRVLTMSSRYSAPAALTGTLIAVYGGFLTGYPLLQLAILEGAVWLPFMLLGTHLSTHNQRVRWHWLAFAGLALGLSWLAGHSQTSWFCTVLATSYLLYRGWQTRLSYRQQVLSLAVMAAITFGATAVTLIPGMEYLRTTTRADLDFAAKANGFSISELAQFFIPGVISVFSPLFIGVVGLAVALWSLRVRQAWFWGAAAAIALLMSFGGNAPFYGLVYPLPTGLSFFRGQERFAFLVNASLAVMAAYGITSLTDLGRHTHWQRYLRAWFIAMSILCLMVIPVMFLSNGPERIILEPALVSTVGFLVTWHIFRAGRSTTGVWLISAVIAVELLRATLTSSAVFVQPDDASLLPAAPLTEIIRRDETVFRVDGFRGLQANYASVEQVQDIRGISPLFITTVSRIVNSNFSHNRIAWELFAVKYVYSDRTEFSTPTRVLADGMDRDGAIVLHQLTQPRSFAHLVYRVDVVDSDEFAWALLNDPRYQPRETLIMLGEPTLPLPPTEPNGASAIVTHFRPEAVQVDIETNDNAVLSLSMVDYPGWQATLDGHPVPIRRAYGALMAMEIPAGQHTLQLTYRPFTVMIGAIISLITWSGMLLWAVITFVRSAR